MKRWLIVVVVILAVALIGGAGYWGYTGNLPFAQQEIPEPIKEPPTVSVSRGDVHQTIIAPGKLVNFNTITLAARTSALVEEIHVHPGDTVEEGQLLMTLDDTSAQERLAQAQRTYAELVSPTAVAGAEISLAAAKQEHANTRYTLEYMISPAVFSSELKLEDAQANLKSAETAFNTDPTEANEVAVENAKSAVTEAEKSLERAQYYYENEYITKTFEIITEIDQKTQKRTQYVNKPSAAKIQEARAKYRLAREKEREAELYLVALHEGEVPEGAGGARIEQLRQAIIKLQNARELLEATKIHAPMSGTILSLDAKVGMMASEGARLIQMADPHALEVLVTVIEEEYPLIQVGQPVELYFDAIPEYEGSGKVSSIVPKRISAERPLYQVYISIDKVPDGVVEGMTADSEIILAQKKDILVLPRALVQAGSDGTTTVSVWVGDHTEEREVTVGLRGNVFIEILSGLEEGDKVVGQ